MVAELDALRGAVTQTVSRLDADRAQLLELQRLIDALRGRARAEDATHHAPHLVPARPSARTRWWAVGVAATLVCVAGVGAFAGSPPTTTEHRAKTAMRQLGPASLGHVDPMDVEGFAHRGLPDHGAGWSLVGMDLQGIDPDGYATLSDGAHLSYLFHRDGEVREVSISHKGTVSRARPDGNLGHPLLPGARFVQRALDLGPRLERNRVTWDSDATDQLSVNGQRR